MPRPTYNHHSLLFPSSSCSLLSLLFLSLALSLSVFRIDESNIASSPAASYSQSSLFALAAEVGDDGDGGQHTLCGLEPPKDDEAPCGGGGGDDADGSSSLAEAEGDEDGAFAVDDL